MLILSLTNWLLILYVLQIVILIGNAASAHDISREISEVAKEVHIASRSAQAVDLGKLVGYNNIWLHSVVKLLIFELQVNTPKD